MTNRVVEKQKKVVDQNRKYFIPKWLLYLAIAPLILGIFFRFANLDTKVYWGDETITSLRISGYSFVDVKQQSFEGKIIDLEDLNAYQYPNSEKNSIDTITGLAAEEPQHPPLYFILARWWVQLFGDSVAVTRSVSAVISLFAFPCIYFLCLELFGSPIVGWIAIALIAVSPLHVLYAQEARSSVLWIVTILLSSWTLLRAMRLKTPLSWGIYTATMTLGMYTIIASGLVAIAHGIYVIVNENFKLTKTVKTYLISFIGIIVLFFPWVFAVFTNASAADETTSWSKRTVALIPLIRTWILNLSKAFIDFDYNFKQRDLLLYAAIMAVILLETYAIYFLCRHTKKQTWLLILTLILTTALAWVVPDLTIGGIRSSIVRYFMPCYVGIQIAVAYLLTTQMLSESTKTWQRKFWQIVTIVLLSGSILSCAIASPSIAWWNKYNDYDLIEAAKIVNQTQRPLIVWGNNLFPPFHLARYLEPKTKLRSLDANIDELSNDCDRFSDIFILSSRTVKTFLEQNPDYKIEQAYKWQHSINPVFMAETRLWKLTKTD